MNNQQLGSKVPPSKKFLADFFQLPQQGVTSM
jgi:hypothetical protein